MNYAPLVEGQSSVEPLGLLLLVLRLLKLEPAENAPTTEHGQERKKVSMPYDQIIKETAEKLKAHMEEETPEPGESPKPICLDDAQYKQILQEVFPMTSKLLQTPEPATSSTTTTLGEDQIKELFQKFLRELQEDNKSVKKQETDDKSGQNQIPDPLIEATMKRITTICGKVEEQLRIKAIIDKIKELLKGRVLVILKFDNDFLARTEETRNALSLLDRVAGALMLTTKAWTATKYCYPPRDPIDYSLVGLYRDIIEDLTSQQMNEGKNYNRQIFCDILDKCEQDEFCMKVFAHALYAKPGRSSEELKKLNSTLQVSPKLTDIIANKMLKFSYRDLPKEYRSCLLYLAIFPQQQSIRRSTLIGRWVAEGLITKEDWPSSVRRANRCFDTLLDRWLVYPDHISATGQVKSCVVGDLVHGFITKVARKQHIVETRLSHHLARHFSIFNDLRLRSSDGIGKFFQRLSESPRVSLLKVLDLENCHYFGEKYQRYLKDICNKMLLLKYLSLRGTNITYLPGEINNLHDLEVLDIRQTNVPERTTVDLLLLKLKRLLAGHIYPSPNSSTSTICVKIPDKIEKMVNVEVLSNVKARNKQDLKDIGKLWQLRKLGVVINDRNSHLKNLLRTISDLHECIRSLSITFSTSENQGIPSSRESRYAIGSSLRHHRKLSQHQGIPSSEESHIGSSLKHHPKLLESLSISGNTQRVHLLQLFSRDSDNKLVKVTLSDTSLNQENWKVLTNLPKLQCVRFRYIAYIESVLTFKKDEFKNLKYLLVEGSNLADIIFEKGAACELEKIVLSFTNIGYISGFNEHLKLEELDLNNNRCGRLLSSFDNANNIAKLTLCGTLLDQVDLQILAKKPNIRCLVLLNGSCDVSYSQINFNKEEFPKLNLFIVDCSTITKIVFTSGSVPKLEKIVWSSPTSLSGIDKLPRLKDLEFKGHPVPDELNEAIGKIKNKPRFKHIEPEIQDQAGEQDDDDNDGRFSSCWKIKI